MSWLSVRALLLEPRALQNIFVSTNGFYSFVDYRRLLDTSSMPDYLFLSFSHSALDARPLIITQAAQVGQSKTIASSLFDIVAGGKAVNRYCTFS